MRIKTMPKIGFGHRIPCPVGSLEVLENNARFLVLLLVVTPNVVIALFASRRSAPRTLKPGMLIRGVVEDQLGNYADAALMRFGEKGFKVFEGAVIGVDFRIARNVVTVVLQR